MGRKDDVITILNETYSVSTRKNFPANKVIYNHSAEKWSMELLDIYYYKPSNS